MNSHDIPEVAVDKSEFQPIWVQGVNMFGARHFKTIVQASCIISSTMYPVAAHANDIGGAIVGGIVGGIIGGAIVNGIKNNHRPVVVEGPHRPRQITSETSDRILKIQQALAFFGFYRGTVDGRSGRGTREAIGEFQRKMNEPVTGELTEAQFRALMIVYAEKTQPTPAGTPAVNPSVRNNPDTLIEAINRVTPPTLADGIKPNPVVLANAPVAADTKAPASSFQHYSTICLAGMALKSSSDSDLVKKMKDHLCTSLATSAAETSRRLSDPKFSDVTAVSDQCKTTAATIKSELGTADAPDVSVAKLREKLKVLTPEQQSLAVEGFSVCAGFGLISNNPEFVQSTGIALAALNEPKYLEFVATSAALGIEEAPNPVKAAIWFDVAADTPVSLAQLNIADPDRQARADYFKSVAVQLRSAPNAASPASQLLAGLVPTFNPNRVSPVPDAPPPVDARKNDTNKAMVRPELVDFIRGSIVMIYAPNATGASLGTGYFISPTNILTNTHVVQDADRMVVVANKTIGVRVAQIIARGMTREGKGLDAAVLEVKGAPSAVFLKLSQNVREGQAITIGGYPDRAQKGIDQAYDDFLSILGGQRVPTTDSIPSPKFDFGYVQALISGSGDGFHNIQVGVNTTHGNSGSPIVDFCGRAIGLDYAGSIARLQVINDGNKIVATGDSSQFSYAIRADEVIKFLKSYSVTYTEAPSTCSE